MFQLSRRNFVAGDRGKMNKKSLKVLSVLLSTIIIFSLSACGNNKTQIDSTEDDTDLLETLGSDSDSDILIDNEEITLIEVPIEE